MLPTLYALPWVRARESVQTVQANKGRDAGTQMESTLLERKTVFFCCGILFASET
jgi:hypothetical protein